MAKKRTVKKTSSVGSQAGQMVVRNQFFGMLLIAIAVGALIVFLRYLIISMTVPADVYLIEPSQLIPGATGY